MRISSFIRFSSFGINTILFRRKKPILGTIILTDRCNLTCKHCAVNNITSVIHPYQQIKSEMRALHEQGIRILFFCGGETFLWRDQGKVINDLVKEAKEMGFLIVNIVTNGTFPLKAPDADLILLSLDGDKESHESIRGECYDEIIKNIQSNEVDNICFYMAINQLNKDKIRDVCQLAKELKQVKAVSFNFHTPYPGTEELALSKKEKQNCCNQLEQLIKEGYPIFNLKSAFPYLVNNTFPTPCYQCVVMENGKQSICGRCIDIPGLCNQCGYFFVAEYTLVFQGKIRVIIDMLATYLKYI